MRYYLLITLSFILILIGHESVMSQDRTTAEKKYKTVVFTTPETYVTDVDSGDYFNKRMLNVLFRKEVSSLVTGSDDVVTNRWYATLGNEDELLSLGGVLGLGKKKTKKITNLLAFGINLKSKSGFATLWEDGDWAAGINGTFKYTFVGKGSINYGKYNHGIPLESYRKNVLKPKYDKEVEKYLEKGGTYDNLKTAMDAISTGALTSKDTASIVKTLKKKSDETYEKMAEEEADFLQEKQWFNFLRDYWVSVEGNIPFTRKKYSLVDTVTTILHQIKSSMDSI